eukprot:2147299-Rhodomonas_salina.1
MTSDGRWRAHKSCPTACWAPSTLAGLCTADDDTDDVRAPGSGSWRSSGKRRSWNHRIAGTGCASGE